MILYDPYFAFRVLLEILKMKVKNLKARHKHK